jgi:hypothetical protein
MWSLVASHSSAAARLHARPESSRFSARQSQEEVVSPNAAPYTGHRALTIAGFLTIAVGAMHLGITFFAYKPVFTLTALWFAGSGVAIMLIGILTLFARRAPAGSVERWVAFGANVAGLVIATSYSVLNAWREPRGYVEIALFIIGAQAALLGGKPAARAAPDESARRA